MPKRRRIRNAALQRKLRSVASLGNKVERALAKAETLLADTEARFARLALAPEPDSIAPLRSR
jgi:hypothetical protein